MLVYDIHTLGISHIISHCRLEFVIREKTFIQTDFVFIIHIALVSAQKCSLPLVTKHQTVWLVQAWLVVASDIDFGKHCVYCKFGTQSHPNTCMICMQKSWLKEKNMEYMTSIVFKTIFALFRIRFNARRPAAVLHLASMDCEPVTSSLSSTSKVFSCLFLHHFCPTVSTWWLVN